MSNPTYSIHWDSRINQFSWSHVCLLRMLPHIISYRTQFELFINMPPMILLNITIHPWMKSLQKGGNTFKQQTDMVLAQYIAMWGVCFVPYWFNNIIECGARGNHIAMWGAVEPIGNKAHYSWRSNGQPRQPTVELVMVILTNCKNITHKFVDMWLCRSIWLTKRMINR